MTLTFFDLTQHYPDEESAAAYFKSKRGPAYPECVRK